MTFFVRVSLLMPLVIPAMSSVRGGTVLLTSVTVTVFACLCSVYVIQSRRICDRCGLVVNFGRWEGREGDAGRHTI